MSNGFGLGGEQRRILREGVLGAYPNPSDLEILLSESMDVQLGVIARGDAYNAKVFNLIQDFEAEGKIKEFIQVIVADKPKSHYLAAIKTEFAHIVGKDNTDEKIDSSSPEETMDNGAPSFTPAQRFKLRQTLRALIVADLNDLVDALQVPRGIIPPSSTDAASRVDALWGWADSPTGCGLKTLHDTLEAITKHYNELRAGWSYEDAFHGGCNAIELQGIQQEHKPILKRKSQFETPSSLNENDIQIPATLGSGSSKLKGNYDQLQSLLGGKNWKEADMETMQILLRIAERTEQGWLLSIDEIPSEDIRKIDFLWLNASKGNFGYSVQKNIWLNVQGELGVFDPLVFYKFAKQVGWQVNDQLRMNYDDFDFSLNAPNGHLPTFRFPSDTDQLGTWLDAFKDFLPRL